MGVTSVAMEIERVTMESDTPGQELSLRVFRFRGSENGPAVYIQGALHSNEMPGMVAIDRLIPLLVEAEQRCAPRWQRYIGAARKSDWTDPGDVRRNPGSL